MKLTLIGYGFVGKATEYLLQKHIDGQQEIFIHDPDLGHKINNWAEIDYAFICVPTNLKHGKLDTTIIDNILSTLYVGIIPVIRSTIGPDQCLNYANKGCIIMPEFLRERHWKEDVDDPNIDILIGHFNHDEFVDLMSNGTKFVKPVTPCQASAIKLFRNAALAMKVALANDFYDICKNTGADYKTLKNFLTTDKNLGGTHWEVPGHDNKKGFGGTCLPKDLTHTSNLCYHTNNIMATAVKANHERRSEDE